MNSDALNTLNTIVETACLEHGDNKHYAALAEWQSMIEIYSEKYPQLQKDVEALQQQAQQVLQSPESPLQYAVYLGHSPVDPTYLVVGVGGTRIEVLSAQDADIDVDQLALGQLVMLNKAQYIVAIRDEYIFGDTAEVINIIKGEEEAEVLTVIDGLTHQPRQLQVRWREKEEITVACSQQLLEGDIQRGDVVRIDPDQKVAIEKARPRLHVRVGGNEGIVVEISEGLAAQSVHIGDIVRIEPGLKFAFEKLPAYETGKLTLEEVPDVTYEDIGGLEEQIEQIYDAIEMPYLFREQFERYQLVRPKGILLYGPPGCGKTMVAKAVANSLTKNIRAHLTGLEQRIVLYRQLTQHPDDPELLARYATLYAGMEETDALNDSTQALKALAEYLRQYKIDIDLLDDELIKIRSTLAKKDGVRSFFLNVKGPELLDKYVGETEHRIRKIFEEARRHSSYYTPVIIFFDEMEAMFRTRGTGRSSDVETTIVPQFLAEIDGVESLENLVIIGASNRQDMIDPAILRPGRLDVKIKIERPTRESARDIFSMYLLPTLPLSPRGITLPSMTGPGEVVFRTAYRTSEDTKQEATDEECLKTIATLLPVGCDLRLVRCMSQANLDELAALPPKSTIREVLAKDKEGSELSKKLRLFKKELEIGELVTCLQKLETRYKQEPDLQESIEHFIRQEWLAETLVLQTVALLYNSTSTMSVLTITGNRFTFPLKDFMSGAVIANIVTRAKRRAIKRALIDQLLGEVGINQEDLFDAIRQEFEENKEQLAQHKIQADMGTREGEVQSVEVNIETGEDDPWSEEKIMLYKTTTTLRA